MMQILNNRHMKILLFVIAAIALNVAAITYADFDIQGKLTLQYTVEADAVDTYQTFYGQDDNWSEEKSIKLDYTNPKIPQTLIYEIPKDTVSVRLDLGMQEGKVILSNPSIHYLWKKIDISDKLLNNQMTSQDISGITQISEKISITRTGKDPYIMLNLTEFNLKGLFEIDEHMKGAFKVLVCLGLNGLLLIFIKKRKLIISLMQEVYNSRTLIWNLSKNDFKTKYAGSYLGITWAFVQPIVTVLVYWFVFEVGFRSAPIENFPYVLWLVAGLVPWFFFSEALMSATNSLIEYNYLVKKVVFKISILPVIKIISAFFVHLFFIGFMVMMFGLYGFIPNLYTLQIVYYTFCIVILVLGLSYATSAIILFFKDLGQVIGILLQVGIWMTPIMWSFNMVPEKYQWVLKINPMYYIVEGYRDSLINHVWFWERFNQTIYFWVVAIGIFGIGTLIFKRLKVHFADVL